MLKDAKILLILQILLRIIGPVALLQESSWTDSQTVSWIMKTIIAATLALVQQSWKHHLNFDSSDVGRQEGSIITAFAKSISWALLLSISSVSWVINLQLWIWYHVTMWDYIDAMWSRRTDIDAKVQDLLHFFLWDQRGSEIDCPGLKLLSCPGDVSLSLSLSFGLPTPNAHLNSPGMAGPGRRPAGGASLGRQQRHGGRRQILYQRQQRLKGKSFSRDTATYLSYQCTYFNPL